MDTLHEKKKEEKEREEVEKLEEAFASKPKISEEIHDTTGISMKEETDICLLVRKEYEKSMKLPKKERRQSLATSKSDWHAYVRFVEAHEARRKEEYRRAMDLYTECIAAAPKRHLLLGLAYAFRAVVLARTDNLFSCLLDINRALNEKCPPVTQELLIKWREVFVRRRLLPPTINFYATDREKIIPEDDKNPDTFGKDFDLSNDDLPDTSPKLAFFYNKDKKSTYIVAKKDIEPGEILLREEFFATIVCEEYRWSTCAHCMRTCYAMIPCPTCSRVAYCTESCRTKALNSYHRVECEIGDFFDRVSSADDWPNFLALRLFLIGTGQGDKLPELMEKLSLDDLVAKNKKRKLSRLPFEKDYYAVINWLSLQTRDESNMLVTSEELRQNVHIAIIMIITLQNLFFFGKSPEAVNQWNEAKQYSTILLVDHLLAMPSNIFSIQAQDRHDQKAEFPIGFGICILQHFLSSSCDKNTDFFIKNRQHYTYAMRPIKAGESIQKGVVTHYYAVKPIEIRQNRHKELYGVACECEACVKKWPHELSYWKNRKVKLKKPARKKIFIRTLEGIFKNVVHSHSDAELLPSLTNVIKLLHSNVEVPTFNLTRLERFFTVAMDKFNSDYHLNTDLNLKKCLTRLLVDLLDAIKEVS